MTKPQRVRPVIKLTIKRQGKPFNLRQYGYTDGDKIVVMLEKDFQRVADVAKTKANKLNMFNALRAMSYWETLREVGDKIKKVEL